jgi:hypothetical protein
MTAAMAAPEAHKIGKPVMLTRDDVQRRRKEIESTAGTRKRLEVKRDLIGLTLEERIALRDLENLDYLEDI